MSIRCGNPKHDKFIAKAHYHDSVAEVRACYSSREGIPSIEEQEYADWNAYGDDPDAAYERHLENQGYWEARADEDMARELGVDIF